MVRALGKSLVLMGILPSLRCFLSYVPPDFLALWQGCRTFLLNLHCHIHQVRPTSEPHNYDHVIQLANFTMEMRELLNEMNRNAFNNFKMKSGLNYGHVVAGVIGITTS